MVYSMTAYAQKEEMTPWGKLQWELRSVNHRYLEVSTRLADDFRLLESEVKTVINRSIKRGKVYCQLNFEPMETQSQQIHINQTLVEQLAQVYHSVENMDNMTSKLAPINFLELLQWPEVMKTDAIDFTTIKTMAIELLEVILLDFLQTRQREGDQLKLIIMQRCQSLQQYVEQIQQHYPSVIKTIKTKLTQRLQEVVEELDQQRLEQEMVLFAYKLDIAEELDRLQSHIKEVQDTLSKEEAIGRRLDFLMQEMNREANTLTSKSSDITITKIAVEIKVLIEQIREQVQNIE